ncbi:MAG: sensor domain-containing diguanylate cyclase [Desulforhabdus sp.]|jgi:diguanylate cyclase (GGDEF)-like protein|nr:sensor domain-containing diguanylate cyclase [Desulforhabdus sp.]
MDSTVSEQNRKDAATLEQLKQENEELRRQLQHLMSTASNNERIWRHFTEIERILFRTRQLDVLVEELLREIKDRFQPDYLILILSHADILERFFPDVSRQNEPIAENTWILPFFPNNGELLGGVACKPSFLTDETLQGLLGILPDGVLASIRSGISIPLCVHEIAFGSLFLGSRDVNRYQRDDGTDLLEQLGVKIALCMDNCLTYEKVKEFAVLDPLTGLMNYFQIHTLLEKEFRKARRRQTPLSILLIDLDFYNATEGPSGLLNEVLKHAAGLLREIIPEEEGYLGRYGSDEFLLVLPNVPHEEAEEVIPYLSQTIRKSPFRQQNTAVLIQATIGVGTIDGATKRPQDLLDAAGSELCRRKMCKEKRIEDPAADR